MFYEAHPDESFEITVDGQPTRWRFGPMIFEDVFPITSATYSEKYSDVVYDFHDEELDKYQVVDVPVVTGNCLVTQIEGPNIGTEAVLSIWKQMANWFGERNFAADINYGATRELWALKSSTDAGATCIPRLLAAKRFVQSQADPYPGGFLWYLLMEKVPGKDIRGFENKSPEEKDEIRIAFIRASCELSRCNPTFVPAGERCEDMVWDRKTQRFWFIHLHEMSRTKGTHERRSIMLYLLLSGLQYDGGPNNISSDGLPAFCEPAKNIEIDPLDEASTERGIEELMRLMKEARAISHGDVVSESISGTM
ncbi:hypothetical protein KEM56_000216 [Ascosphaera pollenicola]|nr:hypothetical protein KEM56_000216 [Ascosphaera pollenicola]